MTTTAPRPSSGSETGPGRRRRAARTVLAFGVAFVLAQVAFQYPATEVCPQLRDPHFGRKLSRLRAIRAHELRGRPLVIATGSSLTEIAFRPAAMPGQDGGDPGRPLCYNFGLSNCGVLAQMLALRRILDDGIRPDLVLIETSPRFLYPEYNKVYDGEYLTADRVYWGDWPALRHYHDRPGAYHAQWREKQYLPWSSYRTNVQLALDPTLVPTERQVNIYPTDEWGWCLPPPGYNEARAGYHLNGGGDRLWAYYTHYFAAGDYDWKMAQAYREMAAMCREQGVRYAMLVVPESSFIREACPENGANHLARLLNRLRTEDGAEILSARDWVPDDEFSDGSHVLPAGAARYSRRVESDILRRMFPPVR